MTALPDVIAGLFIYALFILTLGMQKSGLAASLALAITMMPIVARASEVVIRLVPGTLREASYALGSSQWRTVLNVVLPTARAGLATAVVLAMARGIGETAPVLVVSGVTKEFNLNPLSGPQVSLPLYIWEYAHIEAVNATIVTRGVRGRRGLGRRRAPAVRPGPQARRCGAGGTDQAAAPATGAAGGPGMTAPGGRGRGRAASGATALADAPVACGPPRSGPIAPAGRGPSPGTPWPAIPYCMKSLESACVACHLRPSGPAGCSPWPAWCRSPAGC